MCMYMYMHMYMSMYISMFRDLESGLSKDLKDGERGFEKNKRWWRLVAILPFTSFVMLGEKGDRPTACFPQDS